MAMVDERYPKNAPMRIARWVARVWAALLFVFWGFRFLSNMIWLSKPDENMPATNWWVMVVHLCFLTGLAVGYRWEFAGAILILVTAPIYFFLTDWGPYALAYIILTAVPALIWLLCALIDRRRNARFPAASEVAAVVKPTPRETTVVPPTEVKVVVPPRPDEPPPPAE